MPHVLLLLAGCGPATPTDSPTSLDFEPLAVHPWADVQRTELGRVLWTLTAYSDHIVPGFGDWNDNGGPIRLTATNAYGEWTETWTQPTEAATVMRIIDGELWVPPIDPRLIGPGDFAVASPDLSWRTERIGPATHVFDVVEVDGDLLVTGSIDLDAAIWRRTGGEWEVLRQMPPQTGDFARYYGLGIIDDTVYVQRADAGGQVVAEALAYRNGVFEPAPRMLPDRRSYVFRPEPFDGRLVYQSDTPFGFEASLLIAYDGQGFERVLDVPVRAFTVADDAVWVLTDDAEVLRSTDLTDWDLVGEAPLDCWSLAVLDGVYCGDTVSTVHRSDM